MVSFDEAQELHAGHSGHSLVGHDDVDFVLLEDLQTLRGAGRPEDPVIEAQQILNAGHNLGFIINHQNGVPRGHAEGLQGFVRPTSKRRERGTKTHSGFGNGCRNKEWSGYRPKVLDWQESQPPFLGYGEASAVPPSGNHGLGRVDTEKEAWKTEGNRFWRSDRGSRTESGLAMKGLTTALLGRACQTFLDLAYPEGKDTIPAVKRAYVHIDPAQPLTGLLRPPVCQPLSGPDGVSRGYAFRLGSSAYPHLKMKAVACEAGSAWVFAVDTHDTIQLEANHPDAPAWRRLQETNRRLRDQIEAAWEGEGLLTFKGLLRRGLPAETTGPGEGPALAGEQGSGKA
jgi:hypothetical protein